MQNQLSISNAGSLLLGAGLARLDNIYIGVGLIILGTVLKITVAVLNKNGIEVQSQPLG